MGKGGEFEQVESRTLRVGQVIKIDCDSEIPADVVLLQVWFCLRFNLRFKCHVITSDALPQSSNADGCCFVQTTNM